MAEPGKGEKLPSSPEHLYNEMLMLYSLTPRRELRDKDFVVAMKKISRAQKSETGPKLVDKFDQLIATSPSTQSYKQITRMMFRDIATLGGSPDFPSDDEVALIKSFQLLDDTKTGIFSAEGARKGEVHLYNFWAKIFGIQVSHLLLEGKDPGNPKNLEEYAERKTPEIPDLDNPLQLKDFLLKWCEEFKNLYGEVPMEFIEGIEEDLD